MLVFTLREADHEVFAREAGRRRLSVNMFAKQLCEMWCVEARVADEAAAAHRNGERGR